MEARAVIIPVTKRRRMLCRVSIDQDQIPHAMKDEPLAINSPRAVTTLAKCR